MANPRYRFTDEARHNLSAVKLLLPQLEQTDKKIDLLIKIFRLLHRVRATSAMFGFQDVSLYSYKIEQLFGKVMNRKITIDSELTGTLMEISDHLQLMLQTTDGTAVPDGERANDLLARLYQLSDREIHSS